MTNNELLATLNAKSTVFVTLKESYECTLIQYPVAIFDTLAEAEEFVEKHETPNVRGLTAIFKNPYYEGAYTETNIYGNRFRIMCDGVMYEKGTAGEEWVRQNPDFNKLSIQERKK